MLALGLTAVYVREPAGAQSEVPPLPPRSSLARCSHFLWFLQSSTPATVLANAQNVLQNWPDVQQGAGLSPSTTACVAPPVIPLYKLGNIRPCYGELSSSELFSSLQSTGSSVQLLRAFQCSILCSGENHPVLTMLNSSFRPNSPPNFLDLQTHIVDNSHRSKYFRRKWNIPTSSNPWPAQTLSLNSHKCFRVQQFTNWKVYLFFFFQSWNQTESRSWKVFSSFRPKSCFCKLAKGETYCILLWGNNSGMFAKVLGNSGVCKLSMRVTNSKSMHTLSSSDVH